MSQANNRSPLCDSPREELASAITHGLGVAASIFGLVIMILVAKDAWALVSGIVFGSTLILLYLSSTLYHCFSSPRVKELFQIFDHSAIYLLIAGSYTPLTLVAIRGPLGWSIFGVIWFLALGGILTKALMRHNREHWASTALYVAMGWLVVAILPSVIRELPPAGLWLLVAGGLSYTGGVVFFSWRKLPYNHAIWHLFVLAGSTCHALAIILHILR
ncbi:PAQR family membrane homeostasis protein TrhA [Roseibacillus ishigakijimensis]|uniref:Hemolysin III family protein n=1 Tax=Roseibacillus ishigakijimensis TaxID=454146 RepID=A0A934RRB6_9BACT|nr:hemolysin III family protein [Roseibacillus ishigakijimensis]MBK1834028.1 hemolysin III family protein [Roseibacillus ishigakijimensis]